MDEMNVHIDTLVVDGSVPLSPSAVRDALTTSTPALHDNPIAAISAAIAESVAASRADWRVDG
jgi:hypothetical protein